MIANTLQGASYTLRGAKLIVQPGIRVYAALPLLINTLIFAGGIWAGVYYGGEGIDWLLSGLPSWLMWLKWLLVPLLVLFLVVFVFFSFSLVANILTAPFNGPLAEAVERHLRGELPPAHFSLASLAREGVKAILGALQKLLYCLAWSTPLIVLSLIGFFLLPLLQPFTSFLWFLYGAWMLAFEYVDYPMGNHGHPFAEQRQVLRGHWQHAIGFGSATMAMAMIPLLNFIAIPAGVAGATIFWVERLQEEAARTIVKGNKPG